MPIGPTPGKTCAFALPSTEVIWRTTDDCHQSLSLGPTIVAISFSSSRALPSSQSRTGFVLENVPSVFHPRNRQTLHVFVDTLREAGMEITVFKGNSAEFGVPAEARARLHIRSSVARPEGS